MAKFSNSREALDSTLSLWSDIKPTNTSVRQVYDIHVYPSNSVEQTEGASIVFNIPPQETGLLTDVELVTQFKVQNSNGSALGTNAKVAPVNNFASAMWSLVDVKIDDRMSLLQQMSHAYSYYDFFEKMLNNGKEREDILFARELFLTDSPNTKAHSDSPDYYPVADSKNKRGTERGDRIKGSKSCIVSSKLNVPLFKQHKAIVPSTKIVVTLTRATNDFCLIAASGVHAVVHIEEVYLKCTYVKPQDTLLRILNSKLETTPVTYEFDRQSIVARMISGSTQHHTITNLFEKTLPKFVLFCIQIPESIAGNKGMNPFTFYPIKTLQFYVNNQQYFAKPLTNRHIGDNWLEDSGMVLDNLYKCLGSDHHGSILVTRDNFNLYQFFTLRLTDDRSINGGHYSLKRKCDTRLEIDLGGTTENQNFVLLAYCLHDQQIRLDKQRNIEVIE